jgi:quercetin dioxygenase-like cupin family protein
MKMSLLHQYMRARLQVIVARRHLIAGLAALAVALFNFGIANSGEAKSQNPAPSPSMVTPDAINWQPFAPLGPGVERALLFGDPGREGSQFTLRLKVPDGHEIQPQWHPVDESITVIAGTLYLGIGDKFDRSATHELPAGSVAFVPKKVPHFAFTKGETITEVHGIGPFRSIFVQPPANPVGNEGKSD